MNRPSQSAQRSECLDPARKRDIARNNRREDDADLAATMKGLSMARRDENLPQNLALESDAPMLAPKKGRNTRTTWSTRSSPMQKSTRGNTSSHCFARPIKDGPQITTLTKRDSRRTPSGEGSEKVRKGKVEKGRRRGKTPRSSSDDSSEPLPEPKKSKPPVPRRAQEPLCAIRLLCYTVNADVIFQYSLFLNRGGTGNISSELIGSVGAWQYNETHNFIPTAAGLFKNIFVANLPPSLINTYLLFVRGQSLVDPPDLTSKDWCLKVLERLNEHDVVDLDVEDIRRRSQPGTVDTEYTAYR